MPSIFKQRRMTGFIVGWVRMPDECPQEKIYRLNDLIRHIFMYIDILKNQIGWWQTDDAINGHTSQGLSNIVNTWRSSPCPSRIEMIRTAEEKKSDCGWLHFQAG